MNKQDPKDCIRCKNANWILIGHSCGKDKPKPFVIGMNGRPGSWKGAPIK